MPASMRSLGASTKSNNLQQIDLTYLLNKPPTFSIQANQKLPKATSIFRAKAIAMRSSILALAAAVASCTAREDLMFLPGFGSSGAPVVATILNTQSDGTVYVVGCPAASDAPRCRGYEHPIIATQGQYTAHFSGKFFALEGKKGMRREFE